MLCIFCRFYYLESLEPQRLKDSDLGLDLSGLDYITGWV